MDKQLKMTYEQWKEVPNQKNTYAFILNFAQLLRSGVDDISVYSEHQQAIIASLEDIVAKLTRHFTETLPSLQKAVDELNVDDESSLTRFVELRDSLELVYQLICPYVTEYEQSNSLKAVRQNLNAIDDQVLLQKKIVFALHELTAKSKMINLDPEYYWWIASEYQEKYIPHQRLAEYVAEYVENKIHKQQIDMRLFQLFKEIDYLDVVYQLENDLSLQKMHQEQHLFFDILNEQPLGLAASTKKIDHTGFSWCDAQKKYKVQTFIQSKNQPQVSFTITGEKTPHHLCIGNEKFAVQHDAEQGVYCQVERSVLQNAMQNTILISLQFTDDIVTLSPCI